MTTSRELVYQTLEFKNPERVPRQLWTLPWATLHFPEELAAIRRDFPDDITSAPVHLLQEPRLEKGDPYAAGEYIDPWGCRFTNIQPGVIGEVKTPLIADPEWEDRHRLYIPEELLSFDLETVNQYCRSSQCFIMAGGGIQIFERLQYLRTSAQFYIDLASKPAGMFEVIERIHDFYCRLLRRWCQTEVDAVSFFDDWGAQNRLLIHPKTWQAIFKPLYRDYIEIAHHYGKKIFMHSDGYTLAIFPDLIEMGLDAINAQIFCMGVDKLRSFRGKITFWGELDRQHLLPYGSLADIDRAVRAVKEHLWSGGGCIAQCEFGAGAKPENVYQMFKSWQEA
ncbi:MAG TPA: uroporphyrinogen decarboxylase family protein [Anaerolineaceae bacterium]